ncbi:MAG: hypothetical protein U5K75_01990 [Ahrensia sp.]|nr:hypothetical protein [Ahrensia sp.]
MPPMALAALGGLALFAIFALVWFSFGQTGDTPTASLFGDMRIWRIVRFTLWQAALSTVISRPLPCL